MQDIRHWLNALDLGQYAEAFERNDIEWDVLAELDHDALKDIGVESTGHRLRILKAVKSLQRACAASSDDLQSAEHADNASRAPTGHRARESLVAARELGHANTLGQTLSFAGGLLPALCLDQHRLDVGVRELMAYLSEHRLPFWETFARALEGRLLFAQGRNDEAVTRLRQADTEYQTQGVVRWRPLFLIWLVEAYAARQQRDLAASALTDAHRLIEGYGERWCESELFRVSAELSAADASAEHGRVIQLYQDALRCARKTQAKSFELRAALGLARTWAEQDERSKARTVLAPVYEGFTQGHDTHDLQAAKALLQTLSAGRGE